MSAATACGGDLPRPILACRWMIAHSFQVSRLDYGEVVLLCKSIRDVIARCLGFLPQDVAVSRKRQKPL